MNPGTMSQVKPLHYTRIELESYLPSGWNLDPEQPEGAFDAKKRRWRTMVYDGLDLSWPLDVKAEDATRSGRLPALADAMDSVFRNRLGKPTRGLGLGGA